MASKTRSPHPDIIETVSDEKLKFAVFIDYDNIEIGVKSTLHREFDVDCVLEGIKERGEVVAKVAYGNWSRQASETRAFTEHGIQMVQRDTTPRGDKNGADINLALDALEMAFTRDHINAFAIISGDSDFMALVNKLKQYNKRVYIVGGKAFTSTILQRNCHEFISYESLLDHSPSRSRRGGGTTQRARRRSSLPLSKAVPLIDRALNALEIRGVQPQLGLLKSTMLQLDSAFTENDYGSSSFSNFIEKLVAKDILGLTTIDGHLVVDRKKKTEELDEEASLGQEDALPVLRKVLEANVSLLEMGIPEREIRALVRAADADFNETEYGFSEFSELLNLAQDKGLVRAEADSDHHLRFYQGAELLSPRKRSRRSPVRSKPESAPDTASEESQPEPSEQAGQADDRRPRSRAPRRRRGRYSSTTTSALSSEDAAGNSDDADDVTESMVENPEVAPVGDSPPAEVVASPGEPPADEVAPN